MPTGLPSSVVDVFLSVTNQVPGKHQGPSGRLTELVDAQIRRYTGPGQADERVVVEAREAFQNLASTAHDQATSEPVTLSWANPEMLSSLGNQLVSVAGSVPRVWNDTVSTWTGYPDVRCLSDKLSQEIYHTSNHTIQVPDGAKVGNSTGFVWTETGYNQAGLPITSSWFGVKGPDGEWVRPPLQLYGPADTTNRTLAKIVSDGSRFWVFYNSNGGGNRIVVIAFDETGRQLDVVLTTRNWTDTPGYWDVAYQAGQVMLAQPGGFSAPANVGVQITKYTFTGIINQSSVIDSTMLCNSGVAWLTNDADPNHAYLATMAQGSPSNFYKLYAYQINPATLLKTHQYDASSVANLPVAPDSITGWTVANGGNFDVNLVWTMLAWSPAVHGPVHDPATRNINTTTVTFTSPSPALVRQTQSVILVSRAFQRDGEYYAYTYYQSGSGLVLTVTPLTVTVTAGDYMIGSQTQPITVQAGDYAKGSPINLTSQTSNGLTVKVNTGHAATGITGSDTVAVVSASGLGAIGIPDGTTLLKWNFSGAPANLWSGNQLVVSGSSIAGADGTWDIVGINFGAEMYTLNVTATGAVSSPSGTFSAAGTVAVTAMTAYYMSPSIRGAVTPHTQILIEGGTFSVAGASHSGNNGTFTPLRFYYGFGPNYGIISGGDAVWVATTTQVQADDSFTATVTPSFVNTWRFNSVVFDSSYIGATLAITADSEIPGNLVSNPITAVSSPVLLTTGNATGVSPQWFSPGDAAEIELGPAQVEYTFKLQSVSLDYTFLGATVTVSNASHAVNNGDYVITVINPDGTFVAGPKSGVGTQVNEAFNPDTVVIVITKTTQQQPEFQPMWFITPLLDGTTDQVGCFERGIAYADWRFEGQDPPDGPNTFPLALSSPFLDSNKPNVILPYRAKSFTAGETFTTPQGVLTGVSVLSQESTVGLKRFQLDTSEGHATAAFNELIMPGPLAGGFTGSGFHEQGCNVAPEAPFLIETDHDVSAIGVTPQKLEVQVVFEWMDENGERGYSSPSQALIFNLTTPNNTYTIGGRLPLPLNSSGQRLSNVYGVTNRSIVGVCIYRTATINGVPTTQLYKVTNDLNINGLYDGLGGPGSGFAFPDSYTWYYRDQSLDSSIVNQETLYTSRGLLPRYPAPPNTGGCVWENRTWLPGYDGAVWCSGDKQEGDGNWFFAGFRIPIGNDQPVACAPMEQYLVIGGADRMWYLPAQQFPNNTGTSGSFPQPVQLPFPNGCTGLMAQINVGTVYSSTAGGVWMITRDLKNVWISEPLKDELINTVPITDIQVDQLQRVAVSVGGNLLYVWDPVSTAWYKWRLPSSAIKLAVWHGQFVFQDTAAAYPQIPGAYLDKSPGGNSAIAPGLTLAGISFAQTRAVKLVREIQLVGEYHGPHQLNAALSYPDDSWQPPTSYGPYSPDPANPYLIALGPGLEEAGQYQLEISTSFDGIATPGNSWSLELLSCEVAVDRRQGVFKLPTGQRAV